MRKRKEISSDPRRKEDLIIEVLLDIRDMLAKELKKKRKKVLGADSKRSTKISV